MDKSSHKRLLQLTDYGVLALIFFGYFTFISIWNYFATANPQPPAAASFSSEQNIFSILIELGLLSVAGLYLLWRRFDFSVLDFSVDYSTLPVMLLLILLGGGVVDMSLYIPYCLEYGIDALTYSISTWDSTIVADQLKQIDVWLVLFALLNGFFEEFFFMGLTFAVNPQSRFFAILASIFIRFGFHIYQGLPSAFGIALMGLIFACVRHKVNSLVPFLLVHTLFDIFGSGVIFWLAILFHL